MNKNTNILASLETLLNQRVRITDANNKLLAGEYGMPTLAHQHFYNDIGIEDYIQLLKKKLKRFFPFLHNVSLRLMAEKISNTDIHIQLTSNKHKEKISLIICINKLSHAAKVSHA